MALGMGGHDDGNGPARVRRVAVAAALVALSAAAVIAPPAAGAPQPGGESSQRTPSLPAPRPPAPPSTLALGALLATNASGWDRILARSGSTGALVLGVITGSPAASAGLAAGDVIVAIDDRQVANAERATTLLRSGTRRGRLVTVARARGSARTLEVKLAAPGTPPLEYLEGRLAQDPSPLNRFLFARTVEDANISLATLEQLTRDVPELAEAHALKASRLLSIALPESNEQGAPPDDRARAAREIIDRALSLDPASLDVVASAAQLFLDVGDPARAETEAARAVSLDATSARARHLLGASRFALDRPESALPELRRAVALNPYAPEYYQALARGYRAVGQRAEAEATDKALAALRAPPTTAEGPAEAPAAPVGPAVAVALLMGAVAPQLVSRLLASPQAAPEAWPGARAEGEVRQAVGPLGVVEVVGALGALSIAVPFLGPVFGISPAADFRLEVIDHVVPGVVVVVLSVVLGFLLLEGGARGGFFLVAPGFVLLAGIWIVSTHALLLIEAFRGETPWPQALFHSSTGLPIIALGGWLFALLSPTGPPVASSR